jgi:hypothetical protein
MAYQIVEDPQHWQPLDAQKSGQRVFKKRHQRTKRQPFAQLRIPHVAKRVNKSTRRVHEKIGGIGKIVVHVSLLVLNNVTGLIPLAGDGHVKVQIKITLSAGC